MVNIAKFHYFCGSRSYCDTRKIAHPEEHGYLNHYIEPTASDVDRTLESSNIEDILNDNIDRITKNLSSSLLIGNDTNNSSQAAELSIVSNLVLIWFFMEKKLCLNTFSGNNYISPMQEHDININKLASDIPYLVLVRECLLKDGLLEDDVLEVSLLDLPFANSSSSQLPWDICQNELE